MCFHNEAGSLKAEFQQCKQQRSRAACEPHRLFPERGAVSNLYRTFPARKRGFGLSRISTNNKISPMKFCYDTSFILPKQSQISGSSYKTDLDFLNCFGKKKTPSYDRRNLVHIFFLNECRYAIYWYIAFHARHSKSENNTRCLLF